MKMTAGVLLLIPMLLVGCGSSPNREEQARAACERYVKDRVKDDAARFSGEQIYAGSVKTRATIRGQVGFAVASPAPGGPGRVRQSFMCSVEKQHGDWRLVVLTGLQG